MARTILIADDNPLIRKMLCRMFEAEEGYDLCAEAKDGEEAIDLALKHRPELIILDLSIPVLNGFDAAKKLKELMPHVPIILFTQHADLVNTLLGAHLPFDGIVSKSSAPELLGHVRSLLPTVEPHQAALKIR
jgi:DNA-binding NarL/FixJ family response regulator